jgi:hypothetical protein
MATLEVNGRIVSFDEPSREAVHYLMNLGFDKAEALFNKAVSSGLTTFDCDYGCFKLSWSGASNYLVSKKY